MYERFVIKKWDLEIISLSKSDAGGLKEVIASIKGKNIYSVLKYKWCAQSSRVPDTNSRKSSHIGSYVAVLQRRKKLM